MSQNFKMPFIRCRNLGMSGAGLDMLQNPNLYIVGTKSMCISLTGLSLGQQKLCTLYHDHMQSIGRGAQMGIRECQFQFRNRRWNCTTIQGDSSVFGPVLEIGELLIVFPPFKKKETSHFSIVIFFSQNG